MLAYHPAANGAKWVPMRGTTNNLSPAKDALAWELSNITIPDPLEDMQRTDCFREDRETGRGTVQRPLPRPSMLVLLFARRER